MCQSEEQAIDATASSEIRLVKSTDSKYFDDEFGGKDEGRGEDGRVESCHAGEREEK